MAFVIVNIKGGIGNQMFQYATGRALAHHLGTKLLLDLSYFRHKGVRRFELDRFAISADFLSRLATNLMAVIKREKFRGVPNPMSMALPVLGLQICRERSLAFNRSMFDLSRKVYLEGYWQSEKYFAQIRGIIKSELSLKEGPDQINGAWLDEINRNSSVCIHVRRGDYITNASNLNIYGACTLDYYQRGIDYICDRVSNAKFYIFSDDPLWTKENLKIKAMHSYVFDNVNRSPVEDLRLMIACRHFIIANSSFSWWAAWLSSHSDKLVVAPKKWFAAKDFLSDDLIPDSWVKL